MNDQKRVLILGVGRMGTAISWCMTIFGHHIIGADKDIASAEKLRHGQLKRNTPVDFLVIESEDDIKRAITLSSPDLVISSLPYHQTQAAAFTCIENNTAYCDLGGRRDVSFNINKKAKDANKPIITDLGLAPGWVNILAEEACDSMEERVIDVKTMVGGLPQQKHNPPFNYTVTWSVDGLINEYVDKCEILVNGGRDYPDGMDGLEEVYCRSIDENLEAFYTSGGASHSIQSMIQRGVPNFNYKTLRYKGHNELIKILLSKQTGIDEDCSKDVISKACSPEGSLGVEDQVIIKCIAVGEFGTVWDKEFLIKSNLTNFTAMQKATSFGLSCVANQILNEDISGGKLSYKDVNYAKFNEYLDVLRKALGENPYEIPLK